MIFFVRDHFTGVARIDHLSLLSLSLMFIRRFNSKRSMYEVVRFCKVGFLIENDSFKLLTEHSKLISLFFFMSFFFLT